MDLHLVTIIALISLFSFCDCRRWRDPMQNPDLYQGDILGIESADDRNAIVDMRERWPNGVVAYKMDPGVSHFKDMIRKAMNHIASKTCISFVPYNSASHKGYLRIFPGDGCYSLMGYTGSVQPLSLGEGCEYLGTVIHEFIHAIGFDHEQNRSDRDDYLIIYWNNILEDNWDQFQKNHPDNNWLINDFDYKSIMLYGETAFSKDGRSITMAAKKRGVKLEEVYDRVMSSSDVYRINTLYDC